MRLSLSLVSHGHGPAALALLRQLAALEQPRPARVILTLNLAEPELSKEVQSRKWPFELAVLENSGPRGFGANHNQAFAHDDGTATPAEAFAIVNPDVTLHGNPFGALLTTLTAAPDVGSVYPLQIDGLGRAQDHERRVPTPARLLKRMLARRSGQRLTEVSDGQTPDWVNAAFLVLRAEAFKAVGGFDESYHMYCEDVDLCLRMQMAGWQLRRDRSAVVEHAAQRASHREPRHLAWHLRSLLRLWNSTAYANFLRRQESALHSQER